MIPLYIHVRLCTQAVNPVLKINQWIYYKNRQGV